MPAATQGRTGPAQLESDRSNSTMTQPDLFTAETMPFSLAGEEAQDGDRIQNQLDKARAERERNERAQVDFMDSHIITCRPGAWKGE